MLVSTETMRIHRAAAAVLVLPIACSSTVTGTGASSSGGGGASSGSSQPAGGNCPRVDGLWDVTGGSCPIESCTISQNGCSLSISCDGGDVVFSGTLEETRFTYSGTTLDGASTTCNGLIGGEGKRANGTCSPDEGGTGCLLSLAKRE